MRVNELGWYTKRIRWISPSNKFFYFLVWMIDIIIAMIRKMEYNYSRVFLGRLPLFFGNQYIDVENTEFGGVSNITPDAPQIKPVFEYLTVSASSTVHATMRTGKNEDTQQVAITGGSDTAPVVFGTSEASFEIPTSQEVGPRDSIVFQYDAVKEKWIFKSFTPGTTQSLKALINRYVTDSELGGHIVKKLTDCLDKAQKELDKGKYDKAIKEMEKFKAE